MASVVSSLAVEIGAEISGLQRGLRRADRDLGGFVDSARRQTMLLGAGLTAGVTLPLVGLAATAARAAIQWESAFAGVRKTVDATEAQFASLERGLRDMATGATGSPVAGLENAAVTLAGVAEAAGQLGIAQEYLLEFTETMAMLGMTTNLTAEEAAFNLAQFANITQMSMTDIDRLGATIVALGNNSATTERDIVEFAQRLAGAGSSAGLSEANILALSAAMASVGLNAEAGGTAMTQVMTSITQAVARGGAEMSAFADVAGMSAEAFAQTWNTEPIAALEAFIAGLGEMNNQDQILALDALGLSGIRVSDTLRRLAGSNDLLTQSVQLANTAWDENTALINEAGQRAATTESQINMMGNNLREIGITVGSILLPPLNSLIGALIPILQSVSQMNPEVVQMGVAFAGAAAAAGPLLMVVGALISPVGLIAGGIAAAAVAIVTFKDDIVAALPWLGDLMDSIGQLFSGGSEGGDIFSGLANLELPDISGLIAAIENIMALLRESVATAWASIEPHIGSFIEGIRGFFGAFASTDTAGMDNIAGLLARIVGVLVEIGGSAIGGVLEGLGSALPRIGEAISGIVSAFSIAAETGDIGAALGSLAGGIGSFGQALLGFGAGAANGLIEVIETLTGLELPDMQTIVQSVTGGLAALGGAFENARLAIDLILQGIATSINNNILLPISTLWTNVQAAIEPFLAGIQEGIIDPLSGLWDSVREGVERFWGNMAQIFGTIDADIIQPIAQAIRDVQNAIASLTGGLSAWGGAAENAGAAVGMVTSGQVSPGDFLSALGNAISMEFGGGRALGGAVNQRQFYLVGENGPELFVPGTSGTIVPASSGAYAGGGNVTVNLTAYGQNPFEIYEMVRAAAASADR